MPVSLLLHDPQPTVVLDAEGLPLTANRAMTTLLAGAPLGQARAWLPHNTPELVRSCLQQARAIEQVEAQCTAQLWLWTLIPDVASQCVVARGREASEERVAGREAAKARRLYRLITENTTDLISRHTPDGRFLDASPASWTLLGYWPEALRGTQAQRLFHPQDLAGVMLEARDALHVEGYHTMTYRIRHEAGHYLWFETASRAIRETYTGDVVEVVSVSRDITPRVQAEENRRRLADVVEAQKRQHQDEMAHTARLVTLGELASGIAHEINQPLAAVVNYAHASQRYLQNLANNPQAVERVAEGLERITLHANHAAEVIKRLRGFLRKGRRNVQALDVGEVIRQAVSLCAWEASARQISIDQQLAATLPQVYADRVLLEQVLLNLLRNAIDANHEQHPGGPSRLLLRAHPLSDGRLQISVHDQGPGVSDEQLEQLFTPFYTSKADGLGLGLSMSRSIIEGFGGELYAQPQPEGLLVCCILPLNGSITQQKQESI